MLTQKDQKKIRSKLQNIYKPSLSKKEIDSFNDEIINIIKKFNSKNIKKKKINLRKDYCSNKLWRQFILKKEKTFY